MAMSLEKCKGENRNDFGKRFWKIEKRKREYNSMPPFSWENEVILVFFKKKKKKGGAQGVGGWIGVGTCLGKSCWFSLGHIVLEVTGRDTDRITWLVIRKNASCSLNFSVVSSESWD